MEQTLQALAGILQKSIPTVILLLVLYFYLKAMLFGPIAKVLKQRDSLTVGARNAARQSLETAERKTQEFELKLRDARNEVYKSQEETRAQWLAEQHAQVEAAREKSQQAVQKAKEQIAAQATEARAGLTAQAGVLADQITASILQRSAG
jgi:F-type H+-transporting ATPase subunit b